MPGSPRSTIDVTSFRGQQRIPKVLDVEKTSGDTWRYPQPETTNKAGAAFRVPCFAPVCEGRLVMRGLTFVANDLGSCIFARLLQRTHIFEVFALLAGLAKAILKVEGGRHTHS